MRVCRLDVCMYACMYACMYVSDVRNIHMWFLVKTYPGALSDVHAGHVYVCAHICGHVCD